MQRTTTGFLFPGRKQSTAKGFSLRPKALEAWRAELPVASTGDTAKRLYRALRDVNRLEFSWRERLHFLEFIRPVLEDVLQGLQSSLSDARFPLTEKESKSARRLQALCLEMSLGYKLGMETLLQTNRFRRSKTGLAKNAVGALDYQAKALLAGYIAGIALPDRAWRDLHRIYQIGENQSVLSLSVDERDHRICPANAYLRAVLCTTAAQAGLSPREVTVAYDVLTELAEGASLASPSEDAPGEFAVNLNLDTEPFPRRLYRLKKDNDPRVIVTTELVARLHQARQAPASDLATRLGPHLLEKLLTTWTTAPVRATERRPGGDRTAEVLFGMPAIHNALDTAAAERVSTRLTGAARFSSRHVKSAGERNSRGDVWNAFEPSRELARSFSGATSAYEKRESASLPARPEHWRILDYSSDGYRLGYGPGRQNRIRIDELVAVRAANDWQLGTVRWVREGEAPGTIEIGVHIVASGIRPVAVTRASSVRGSPYQPAFVLPGTAGPSGTDTLLLASALFDADELLKVYDGHRDQTLQLCGRRRFLGPLASYACGEARFTAARQTP